MFLNTKTIFRALLLLLCVVFPLAAYTDPGTGAMAWQLLMAGCVGGLFYFRRALDTVRRRLRR
jgi:hypothetical protein